MERRHMGYLLKWVNPGIKLETAWIISSQTWCILDTDGSWDGSLGWIIFKTSHVICSVICWKKNQERINVYAVWMVITPVSSSEKFLTWVCNPICLYKCTDKCIPLFAGEILILKKIIQKVCFLGLDRQNFPTEVKRNCDDEGHQGWSPISAFNIKCLSQILLLTGDTDSRTGPFHNYFQSFLFITLFWLQKQQPASVLLFLQLFLDNHKANINHINDSVHHWNANLQTNNSDSMDHFSTGFWIWNDLSLSEKNWHCPI